MELNLLQPPNLWKEELQCLLMGCLFILLGVANFSVTATVRKRGWDVVVDGGFSQMMQMQCPLLLRVCSNQWNLFLTVFREIDRM